MNHDPDQPSTPHQDPVVDEPTLQPGSPLAAAHPVVDEPTLHPATDEPTLHQPASEPVATEMPDPRPGEAPPEPQDAPSAPNDAISSFDAVMQHEGLPLTQLAYLVTGHARHAEELVAESFARVWPRWSARRCSWEAATIRRSLVGMLTSRRVPPPSTEQPSPPPESDSSDLEEPDAAEAASEPDANDMEPELLEPSEPIETPEPPSIVADILALPVALRTPAALRLLLELDNETAARDLRAPVSSVSMWSLDIAERLQAPDLSAARSEMQEATLLPPLVDLTGPSPAMVAARVGRRRHRRTLLLAAGVVGLLAVGAGAYAVAASPSNSGHTVVIGSGGRSKGSSGGTGRSGSSAAEGSSPGNLPGSRAGASSGTATSGTTTPTSPTQTSVAPQTLSPADSPAAVPECTETISEAADGTVSPLWCPDGGVNVLAWQAYAKLGPSVMALGPSATIRQVTDAMCSDLTSSAHLTSSEEKQAASLAARYHGWAFSVSGFNPSSCAGSTTSTTSHH